jgi:hypothetical protein
MFVFKDVATDRLSKVTDGKYGNHTYSAQMLISCAILRNNANGCSPSSTDYAWNYLNHFRDDGGFVYKIFLILFLLFVFV